MKKIRNTIILLLLFNGINALVGGWMLIDDPSGNAIQLTAAWLKRTPFHDFLVPGLLLFTANGLLSLLVAVMVKFKLRYESTAVIIQGFILITWITAQVILMETINFLHLIMGAIGFALVVLGSVLDERINTTKELA